VIDVKPLLIDVKGYTFTDEDNTNWLWTETGDGVFSAAKRQWTYIMPLGEGNMLVISENTLPV